MSDSLKDQLLGLGFKPAPNPERRPAPKPARAQPPRSGPKSGGGQAKPRPSGAPEEMDLAKAFALRSAQEKREREQAEREKQEKAQAKRQAKEAVDRLLAGRVLNSDAADIARHFMYGGKIKRVYVTPEQLTALNAGELGVVQFNGRYCLVSKDVTLAVRDLLPALVALYCDGNEESLPDDYADPKYQVPDDLIW